jgi:hypothetical protein
MKRKCKRSAVDSTLTLTKMSESARSNPRSYLALLEQTREDTGLPDEFNSNDVAKNYFTRIIQDRQAQLRSAGEWKDHDCSSASRVIYSEIQSPLYKLVLMQAPFTVDVAGGFKAPMIVSVSTHHQVLLLSAEGWTRCLHCTYSANATIPVGILSGSNFTNHSTAGDTIAEQYSEPLILAPPETPISRVVPSAKGWWSMYFKSKRWQDVINFWENGDSSFLPAKDWTSSMLKTAGFNIDTYKYVCQAVCTVL